MATILLVGADLLVRDWMQDFLANAGYVVVALGDAAAALAAVRTAPPDLVIIHTEPEENEGAQLLPHLLRFPALRVITVSSSSEHVAHARGPGAYPSLVKPFEPAKLLDLVRHELGRTSSAPL